MSEISASRAPRGVPLWLTVFFLSLIPGLTAFIPGFFRAVWNLSDPMQQAYLTPSRIVLLVFLLVAVFAPFIGGVVSLALARRSGRSWSLGLRTASAWAFALGVFACLTVMFTWGGF